MKKEKQQDQPKTNKKQSLDFFEGAGIKTACI